MACRKQTKSDAPAAKKLDATQAKNWGLVTEIADNPLTRAQAVASEIAGKGPNAIRAAKRLIDFAESGAPRGEVLLRESAEQVALLGKPEQLEVVAAQMQKRAPVFK